MLRPRLRPTISRRNKYLTIAPSAQKKLGREARRGSFGELRRMVGHANFLDVLEENLATPNVETADPMNDSAVGSDVETSANDTPNQQAVAKLAVRAYEQLEEENEEDEEESPPVERAGVKIVVDELENSEEEEQNHSLSELWSDSEGAEKEDWSDVDGSDDEEHALMRTPSGRMLSETEARMKRLAVSAAGREGGDYFTNIPPRLDVSSPEEDYFAGPASQKSDVVVSTRAMEAVK